MQPGTAASHALSRRLAFGLAPHTPPIRTRTFPARRERPDIGCTPQSEGTRMARSSDEAKVAELWDQNAELWTRQVRAGQDLFREVFSMPIFLGFIPDLSGRDVLDAGCGEGRNTRLFARRGATMTAVDISPRLLEAAQD